MAETDEKAQAARTRADVSETSEAGLEPQALTDEQLDKVSGGQGAAFTSGSNVLETRHDTAKNVISNVR